MDKINNSINFTEKTIYPYGLQLLRSNHMGEDEAVKQLTICCNQHPFGCGHETECLRQWDIRTESWPLQPYSEYKPKFQTDKQKYADWMGSLSRRTIITLVRERRIY